MVADQLLEKNIVSHDHFVANALHGYYMIF